MAMADIEREILIEEAKGFIENNRWIASNNLKRARQRYEKLLIKLTRPAKSFWKNPAAFIMRRIMEIRSKNTRENIIKYCRRLKKCARAIKNLKKGDLDLTIEILDAAIAKTQIFSPGLTNIDSNNIIMDLFNPAEDYYPNLKSRLWKLKMSHLNEKVFR